MPQRNPDDYAFLLEGEMYQRLSGYARKLLNYRADQADYQPDSVVNSAIRGVLTRDNILEYANDEDHLQAILYTAIRWKVAERIRGGGDKQTLSDNDHLIESSGSGPLENLIASEVTPEENTSLDEEVIHARVRTACKDERDRILLDERLLADPPRPWKEIAAQIGCEVSAAKTAMSRLKPKLLEALVDPLRLEVSGEDWMILRHTIIQRHTGEKTAHVTGLSIDQILERCEDILYPLLVRKLGATGMAYLWQLHGGMERSPTRKQS